MVFGGTAGLRTSARLPAAGHSSENISPAPHPPRSRFIIVSSRLRRGKPFSYHNLHGYRRGGTFDSPKVPKSDLG